MLHNSGYDKGLPTLEIEQMMDQPTFSKRVARSSGDFCTLCVNELPNNIELYQIQCPTEGCKYSLCHSCIKRVFSFKYIRFYRCFICDGIYQLKDAEEILKKRLIFVDDPTLQQIFEVLLQNLPKQFQPEVIRQREQQQKQIEPLKNIQKVFTECIVHPDMDEQEVETLRRMLPDDQANTDEQPEKNGVTESTNVILSGTCIPAINRNQGSDEQSASNTTIWSAICKLCSCIWDNIKQFTRFVANLIVSICSSLNQYIKYCPPSLRPTLKREINQVKQFFEHAHQQ